MKGVLPEQLHNLGLQIMLANTYHLGTKPVCKYCLKQNQSAGKQFRLGSSDTRKGRWPP